jgi:hypothetical protein
VSNFNDVLKPLPGLEDPSSVQPAGYNQDNLRAVDPNNPVWGVGGALLLWIGTFVIQAIIPVLVLIPFAMHRGLNPSSPDFGQAFIELAKTDGTAILLQVVSILPTHILTLAVLWAFVTRFGKRPFLASFGWGWSRMFGGWEALLLVILGVALFITLIIIAGVIAKLLGTDQPTL